MKFEVRKLCTMAILAALSLVLVLLIHFPIIPAAPWLEYDPAEVPILIGGFVYGPIAGLIITVITALIQALTVSAQSGWVGFVMHVIPTGTLVLVSSIIYKYNKTRKGALIALIIASIARTAVMIPANLFFTVRYWGQPLEVVKASIVPVIIPFNLIKSVANSLIVFLVYKSLRKIVK